MLPGKGVCLVKCLHDSTSNGDCLNPKLCNQQSKTCILERTGSESHSFK